MGKFGQVAGSVTLAAAVGLGGSLVPGTGAAAAPVTGLPSLVAYVRDGDVYVSSGATERRLTTGGGYARPRWSADGRRLAVLKKGQVWVMNADGAGQRRLSTRPAGGASWSPDGKWIAFASLSCTGGPGVYRIPATAADGQPEVLFPRDCRGEDLPAETTAGPATGSLRERLRYDDAVAWSPDGSRVAFRGGDCESTYDACLTIGTVATGAEQTVDAYGGGGTQNRGFAVVPSWRPDGAKLSWTAYQGGETAAGNKPVHLVEYDTATGTKRTVGGALDRELAYVDAGRAVVTSRNNGGSWLTLLGLAGGGRTLLRSGSQPSVQPLPR
ncbi:TolB family protein [Actinoplanes subglobosus]|uniref:WD40 repeat protein n=1 Tax=Actinoplanes subglobosus TaxID=1547892 RepID=A0ABV8IMC1_9ACTN